MPATRIRPGTWRRSAIALSAAAAFSMFVLAGAAVALGGAPASPSTPVVDLQPDCGSACPDQK